MSKDNFQGSLQLEKYLSEAPTVSLMVMHKGGNITTMVNKFADSRSKFSHEGKNKYKFVASKDKIEKIKKYIDAGKLGKSTYEIV